MRSCEEYTSNKYHKGIGRTKERTAISAHPVATYSNSSQSLRKLDKDSGVQTHPALTENITRESEGPKSELLSHHVPTIHTHRSVAPVAVRRWRSRKTAARPGRHGRRHVLDAAFGWGHWCPERGGTEGATSNNTRRPRANTDKELKSIQL